MDLLQLLRRHRRPVNGAALADELGVSIRTLYRDIATLQGLGADIEGEPGVGYSLRPGFFLPPLMLSTAETEALMLGIRWVSAFADRPLADAAAHALSKICEVLPESARDGAGAVPLRVGPPAPEYLASEDLSVFRDAIRRERKLQIEYLGASGIKGTRLIWPFAIGYFNEGRILVGWCETRDAFRHFRTDRIIRSRLMADTYPRRRQSMLVEWKNQQLERVAPDRP